MKKTTFVAAIAATLGMASCTAQGPKAELKTDLDSLSYIMGGQNSQGLKDYAIQRLGVDSAQWESFIKGIKEGMKETDASKTAYLKGVQIGQQVSQDMFKGINAQFFEGDSTQTLSKQNFLAGFLAAVEGKDSTFLTPEKMDYVKAAQSKIQEASMLKRFGDWKKENEEFLTKNKTNANIKTTPSGLQYEVITEGKGEIPAADARVKVHYKGTLIDGTEFDSSYSRNEPATFGIGQVIKGWTEALQLMSVGSKWKLYIPQELAYGTQNMGTIKPFSTLVFEVELLSIEKE